MGALPKPTLPPGPDQVLFDALHALHHRAGWPSLRDMAREVGCSHTTISAAFAGPKVPRWGLLELIVETLHGDTAQFHDLWLATGHPAAPAAAPAAGPTNAAPRQLPADVVGFTGRAGQLGVLHDQAARAGDPGGPVVISALSGTAGVGKTALAVHWAHAVADRFPDGQLYLDLRGYGPAQPVAPAQALEVFLRALSPPGTAIPHELADRAARYRTLLTDRRVLVLLDNAQSLAQIRDLLPGSGSCHVLVTSRDALPALVARYGAVRLNLDLLPSAEAVALLRTLIGARVDAEPDAAAELAGRCARLPLALRIAAELATGRPSAPLGRIVAELGDQTRRLDLLNAGDDEYTAVRAVFSWSRHALSAEADRAFQLLGAHPCGQLDADAVAALLDASSAAAYRLLDVLVRGHLVAPDGDRYGMHDLLRVYAAEQAADQLGPAEVAAALDRLAEHYLTAAARMVHRAGEGDTAARDWLEAERANLLTVARLGHRYAAVLSETLADHLDTSAHFDDALALHELARKGAADPTAEAAVLSRLGGVHRRLGAISTAVEHYGAALDSYRSAADRRGQATALRGLGLLYWRSGRHHEAQRALEEALALCVDTGDRSGEGMVGYTLGSVHLQLGHYREAVAHHRRALEIHREEGNRLGEARTLNNLGAAYERLGRLDEAHEHYRRALAINEEVGNRMGIAVARTNLGCTLTRLGRYAEALHHHEEALEAYQQAGYRQGEADARCGIGLLHLGAGRYEAALVELRRAAAAAAELGDRGGQADAQIGLGGVLRALGDPAAAAGHYQTALRATAETGDRYRRAQALTGLGELSAETGDRAGAAAYRKEALALYTDLELPEADTLRTLLAAPAR